jgi:aryl sulfotransferase
MGGIFWAGGAETFIYKGTNGRWRDVLSKQEILRYEQRAIEELGDECAEWLKGGH